MQAIKERIQKNHNTLRRQQINNLISQTRSKMFNALNQQFLDHLVALPLQELSQEDFKVIIHMANNDSAIALIHLSKIVDAGLISQEILKDVKWTLGKNDKWTLLLSALTYSGICNQEFFYYCTKRILVKQSSINLEYALKMFLHHAKTNESPINFIKENISLISAITTHTYDDSDRISFLALSLLVYITSKDQKIPHFIVKSVGLPRVLKMLLNSLLKIDTSPRAVVVQLANNFELSGIILQPIRRRLIDLIKTEKEKVLCEISYFLRSLIQKASMGSLRIMIQQYDLPLVLHKLKNRQTKKKYAQQISTNLELCFTKIEQLASSNNLILRKKDSLEGHEIDIQEISSTIVQRRSVFQESY